MYALWKTQGITVEPWRADVRFGTAWDGDALCISVVADRPWTGRLIFDKQRHKVNLRLPLDYPRINQFPEWFTAEAGARYEVRRANTGEKQTRLGEELTDGLAVSVQGGEELRLAVKPSPAVEVSAVKPLSVEDFDLSGSEGSTIDQIGPNWFKLTLGRVRQPSLPTKDIAGYPPGQETWANWIRFNILRNARGNALRMDVEFPGDGSKVVYPFTNYDPCWSYDGAEWPYVPWQKGAVRGRSGTLVFPAFEKDTVSVAAQLPMTLQDAENLLAEWRKHPHVRIQALGESLQGRTLYRVEITDPESALPRARRWVHHFANQHPGEGVSQWYIAGMVRWFLSDDAAATRKRTIGHFTLMMNPDGVANGWCRVNAQGIDMNRSFRLEGADTSQQPHEALIFQQDFEALMQSEAPVTTSWSMHSWKSSQLEPMLVGPGPEIGTTVGPLDRLAELLHANDPERLVKAPRAYPEPTPKTFWDAGPHRKYGISNFLVEGGGGRLNKRQAQDAGAVLMKSLTEFYPGAKGEAAPNEMTLTVSADGTGQFRTVQAAVDSLPLTNQQRVVILIKNGDYPDQVRVNRSFVTLRGEDRHQTRLCAAVDSDRIARGQDWTQANPANPPPSRATLEIDGASDVAVENLTITNPFPTRGYAFAVFTVNGATRLSFVNCDLTSTGGDTVSPWSRGLYYFRNCRFSGTYHFFGPRGTAYVIDCQFWCLGSPVSLFNEGIDDETDKLVVRNSTFDGPAPFGLGSHFRDAAWYFIGCKFSDKLKPDGRIFRKPVDGYAMKWGVDRIYFSGCEGPDYPWLKDNIAASTAKRAEAVTAQWTLRGWDPEAVARNR